MHDHSAHSLTSHGRNSACCNSLIEVQGHSHYEVIGSHVRGMKKSSVPVFKYSGRSTPQGRIEQATSPKLAKYGTPKSDYMFALKLFLSSSTVAVGHFWSTTSVPLEEAVLRSRITMAHVLRIRRARADGCNRVLWCRICSLRDQSQRSIAMMDRTPYGSNDRYTEHNGQQRDAWYKLPTRRREDHLFCFCRCFSVETGMVKR